MSLKFIYGKSGTGKSQYIFNEIKENINKEANIFIITPEQFSFTAEKKLLEAVESSAVINAEVLTFNRMAFRIMSQLGLDNRTQLLNSGKKMLLYSILDENKEKLKFLGKSNKNIELADTLLTELKKHNISNENVKDILDKVEDKRLKIKLEDINLIYNEFENAIVNQYIDENDVLTYLWQNIEKVDIFKNSIIYIDEFNGFTKQEYEVIRKLLKLSNKLIITICMNEEEKILDQQTDIFYPNKLTAMQIADIAKCENIKIEDSIILKKAYRFKNKELSFLEENIYENKYKEYEENVNNISIFLSNNPYSELEYVAQNILKLVRQEEYRYSNIAIITKNIDSYSNIAKAVFEKYNIPIFIDEKKDLNQNIIVKFILALIEVFSTNWSYQAVFNYIKTGLIDIDDEDIYILENYCIKWGIRSNQWYKEDWTYEGKEKLPLEKLNSLRKIIVEPLLKFKESLNRIKTVEDITKEIYRFLIENNIDKKLEYKIEKFRDIGRIDLANEYSTSWNIIMSILDEIVLVLGNKKVSFEKYSEILKIGLSNSDLGRIPESNDKVVIGDIDRSRSHKIRALFIIGIIDRCVSKYK